MGKQEEAVKRSRIINIISAIGAIAVLCASCAPVVVDIERTSTPITPRATATETMAPTLEVIDQEMFHNFPASYQALLTEIAANPDSYVRSPDPISDRAAFDRWFTEQLVPALGPESERQINMDAGSVAGGSTQFGAGTLGEGLIGPLSFFYFEHNRVVYPVPCAHAAKAGYPGTTICIALFDSPSLVYGTSVIELFNSGTRVGQIKIYYDLAMDRPDLDWGEMAEISRSIGYYMPGDGRVIFGFGEWIAR